MQKSAEYITFYEEGLIQFDTCGFSMAAYGCRWIKVESFEWRRMLHADNLWCWELWESQSQEIQPTILKWDQSCGSLKTTLVRKSPTLKPPDGADSLEKTPWRDWEGRRYVKNEAVCASPPWYGFGKGLCHEDKAGHISGACVSQIHDLINRTDAINILWFVSLKIEKTPTPVVI